MLHMDLLCVGNLKEGYWKQAMAEYEKRLTGTCKIRVIEIEEARLPAAPSPLQIEAALQEEGRRIIQKILSDAYTITLCIEGKSMSSEAFSALLADQALAGKSRFCSIIGGSHGLADEVKARAHLRLSFSPMTFPHQLARVLLMEQFYRAVQIQQNGKYHK